LFSQVHVKSDSKDACTMLSQTPFEKLPAKFQRWRIFLQNNFQIEFTYLPGKSNVAADFLSRQIHMDKSLRLINVAPSIELLQELVDSYTTEDDLGDQLQLSTDSLGLRYLNGKIYVPPAMRSRILEFYHDKQGHPGSTQLKQSLTKQVTWPKIYRMIDYYVATCTGCQHSKPKPQAKNAAHLRIASHVWDIVSVDLIEFATRSHGYKYVLVIMDEFSSFMILRPIRNKTSQTIYTELLDCFTTFDFPQFLLSDNGTEFLNNLIEKLLTIGSTTHHTTFPYSPTGNARNERSHRVIVETLRIVTNSTPTHWFKYIRPIQYILNSRKSRKHGLSPFQIMFLRSPKIGIANTLAEATDVNQTQQLANEIWNIIRSFQPTRDHTVDRFEVGEKVLLNRPILKDKLLYPYTGPYVIEGKKGNNGYKLKLLLTGEYTEAHTNQLVPYRERKDDQILKQNNVQPTNDDIREANEDQSTMDQQKSTNKKKYPDLTSKFVIYEIEEDKVQLGLVIKQDNNILITNPYYEVKAKTHKNELQRKKIKPGYINNEGNITTEAKNDYKKEQQTIRIEEIMYKFDKLDRNEYIPYKILDRLRSKSKILVEC